MIEKTIQKIVIQLETITSRGLSISRALDLLEASTSCLDEILALNTMRESLEEMSLTEQRKLTQNRVFQVHQSVPNEVLFGLA